MKRESNVEKVLNDAFVTSDEKKKIYKLNLFETIKGVKVLRDLVIDFSNRIFEEEIKKLSDANFAIAPFSLFYFLCYLSNGAQDSTKEQLLTILKLIPSFEENREYINELIYFISRFNMQKKNKTLFLDSKYMIMYDKKALVLNKDLNLIKECFFKDIKYVAVGEKDFETQEKFTSKVNKEIDKITNNKLPNLIEESMEFDFVKCKDPLVLVQTNHIDLKWNLEGRYFKEKDTISNFKFSQLLTSDKSSEKKLQVEMMTIKKINLLGGTHAFKNCKFESILLPFENGQFSMMILLPENEGNKQVISLEEKIFNSSGNVFSKIREEQSCRNYAKLQIPKFNIRFSKQNSYPLQKMGLKIPFSENANFYDLANEKLKIFEIFQHVAFDVQEIGVVDAESFVQPQEKTKLEEEKKKEKKSKKSKKDKNGKKDKKGKKDDKKENKPTWDNNFIADRPFFVFILNAIRVPLVYCKVLRP